MPTLLPLCFLLAAPPADPARAPAGRVVVSVLDSENLRNDFGENSRREVAVYLPPGYDGLPPGDDGVEARYPVIYFLHGFGGDHTLLAGIAPLLDGAIARRKIRPFIMAVSNQKTTYGGSFYSNTGAFGDWEDFTAFDVVSHVDGTYRTIADRDARGIAGHSMGGYGALKLAMRRPDRFGAAYALSPGALAIVGEYGPDSDTYRTLAGLRTAAELDDHYFAKVAVAFGRSWSPNPDAPPFYCDVPFGYEGRVPVVDGAVLKKWHAEMPFHMPDDRLRALGRLNAVKLDWGRNAGDRFTAQCGLFSRRLEALGVDHFAEEYLGDHGGGIFAPGGRLPAEMLPFFDDSLRFAGPAVAPREPSAAGVGPDGP